MARKKLLIENNYDFFLFGISCHEKPYRLCWALNGQLKISFQKGNDCEVHEKNNKLQSNFPVFFFRDEEKYMDYRIIVNKTENKKNLIAVRFLVPEYKQADYLLMVQGELGFSEKNTILKKVKEVTFIQTAFEIQPQKLKSKENLIF